MSEWRTRSGYEFATKASAPGIWRLRAGGYLVDIRVRNKRGKGRTRRTRALYDASLAEAKRVAEEMRQGARAVARGRTLQRTLWSAYAASLYERKVLAGDLKSPKSMERWDTTLRHHLIPPFGDFWCEELRYADIVHWKDRVVAPRFALPARVPHPDPELAKRGRTVRNREHYAPSTANGWLSILRVVCRQMAAELELERDPAAAVTDFDLSAHQTYTHEAPNALTPEWAQRFLAAMRERWPQHYAMTLLGFVTGLRPSSMRPLRRVGPNADVNWDEGYLLVRRSNAKGQLVVDRTKTGKKQRIDLPAGVLDVMRGHFALLESDCVSEDDPRMESELLFPARHGGMLARSVLDRPFRDVAKAIGLPFPLTPRAMRRTNKDLMRAAAVPDVISKAISGHATESMHERYSTASSHEVRHAIGKVGEMMKGESK